MVFLIVFSLYNVEINNKFHLKLEFSYATRTLISSKIMDAVIIYHKENSYSWNAESIINSCFDKISFLGEKKVPELRKRFYDLQEIEHNWYSVAAAIRKANVQIIIITHPFITHLQRLLEKKSSPLTRILNSRRIICICVGVTEQDGLEKYLPDFNDWFRLELHPATTARNIDRRFCKIFMERIIKIHDSSTHLQTLSTSNSDTFNDLTPTSFLNEELNYSSISKIHKIVVTINETVHPGDEIRIEILKADSKLENPKRTTFCVPDSLSDELPIQIKLNADVECLRCDYSIFHGEKDCLDDIIQALPTFRTFLDEQLAEILSKKLEAGSHDLQGSSLEFINEVYYKNVAKFPTLMHLASHYGLELTAWILLEKGSGLEMCNMKNEDNQTPSEIAQAKCYNRLTILFEQIGHNILNSDEEIAIKNYSLQTNDEKNNRFGGSFTMDTVKREIIPENGDLEADEFQRKYSLTEMNDLKDISSTHNGESESLNESSILTEIETPLFSLLDDEYLVFPESKPILPPKTNRRKTSVFKKKDATLPRTEDGYLFMQSCKMESHNIPSTKSSTDIDSENEEFKNIGSLPATDRKLSNNCALDPSDEELIHVMTAFKTNALDLNGVLTKFETWKRRSDVKKYDDERQAFVQSVRQEYCSAQSKFKAKRGANLGEIVDKILGRSRQRSTSDHMLPKPIQQLPIPISTKGNTDQASNNCPSDLAVSNNHSNIWGNALSLRCIDSYIDPNLDAFLNPTECSLDEESLTATRLCQQQNVIDSEASAGATLSESSEESSNVAVCENAIQESNTESDHNNGVQTSTNKSNTSTIGSLNTTDDLDILLIPPPRPPKKAQATATHYCEEGKISTNDNLAESTIPQPRQRQRTDTRKTYVNSKEN